MSENLNDFSAMHGAAAEELRIKNLTDLISEFCIFLKQHGIAVTPFSDRPLDKYKTLPEPVQIGILQGFRAYFDVMIGVSAEGVKIGHESKTSAWWALKKMEYVPKADFFSFVEEDDVIEFYNLNSIQIFRTLNMFSLLSYSLDQVISHEWSELFTRDQEITDALLEYAEKYCKGKLTETLRFNLPTHKICEIFSIRKNAALMEPKVISPFYDRSGQVAGYMTTFRAKLIKAQSQQSQDSLKQVEPFKISLVPPL